MRSISATEVHVFDTDVLSLLMKGRLPESARARLRDLPRAQAATTAITIGELHFGALRTAHPSRWLDAVARVELSLSCLPFDSEAARRYGGLRAYFESRGRRLADPGLRIAATCLAREATLVSGNARHFERVPGLRFENWLAP